MCLYSVSYLRFYVTRTFYIPLIPIQIFFALKSQNHLILKKMEQIETSQSCAAAVFEISLAIRSLTDSLRGGSCMPCRHFDKWRIESWRETSKKGSSLISTGGGAPPTGGPSAVTSTLRRHQIIISPNNPLCVKNHPKNLKKPKGMCWAQLEKCPLLTDKNNSNCWQPAGRLYFATSKRSTADGPPRRTIKVKTPSIHPYLTNTLKVESQFWCVFWRDIYRQ